MKFYHLRVQEKPKASRLDLPFHSYFVAKQKTWLCGYPVETSSHPPQNLVLCSELMEPPLGKDFYAVSCEDKLFSQSFRVYFQSHFDKDFSINRAAVWTRDSVAVSGPSSGVQSDQWPVTSAKWTKWSLNSGTWVARFWIIRRSLGINISAMEFKIGLLFGLTVLLIGLPVPVLSENENVIDPDLMEMQNDPPYVLFRLNSINIS